MFSIEEVEKQLIFLKSQLTLLYPKYHKLISNGGKAIVTRMVKHAVPDRKRLLNEKRYAIHGR